MTKIWILSLLIFVPAVAAADFSGQWEGSGNADLSGTVSVCDKMSFTLNQQPTSLTVVSGSYSCGLMASLWTPTQFDIRQNELWSQNSKVGTIDNSKIHVELAIPESEITEVYDIVKVSDKQLNYIETWYDPHRGLYLKVTGNFQKTRTK